MHTRSALLICCSFLLSVSAQAGADRFGVTYVPAAAARAQVEKAAQTEGSVVLDFARNANHSVLLVRRTAPGSAEIHTVLTDVWYVIDGSGTLVTGGKAVNLKETASNELRGNGISGGIARHIGKGDIIDIPAGVPHWVRKIDGKELVYLTVKVATPKR